MYSSASGQGMDSITESSNFMRVSATYILFCSLSVFPLLALLFSQRFDSNVSVVSELHAGALGF